jgi:hypothetical protein
VSVVLPATERGELAGFHDLWTSAPAEVAARLGVAAREIGSAVAFFCASAPLREFNRVIGLTRV